METTNDYFECYKPAHTEIRDEGTKGYRPETDPLQVCHSSNIDK